MHTDLMKLIFVNLQTLQKMKEVAREYDDTYLCGFKHIESKFCYYQVLG